MRWWQFIIDGKCPSRSNMDRDIQCLDHVIDGRAGGILRIYDWDEPAVTIGHHARAFSLYDPSLDIPVIPRPTGGGAVLHKDDITFSLSVPERGFFSHGITRSYLRISRIFARALHDCGMQVSMEGSSKRFSRVCFDRSAPEELVFAGRKIMGLALLRSRGCLLFQGVLPLRIDKGLMDSAFGPGAAQNSIGILDALPSFQTDWFFEYLSQAFAYEMGSSFFPHGDNHDEDCDNADKGKVHPGRYEV